MTELPYTGERAIPWEPATGGQIMHRHVTRYAWALPFCEGKRVVDLGSGSGYGTFMLSWVAREAIGIELACAAWAFSIRNFRAQNLRYYKGDITGDLPDADVYVAFDVLEHLDDPGALTKRIDKPLLWAVPVFDDSQFHRQVYSPTRAAYDFGGDVYWQSDRGYIVPRDKADFRPINVLGVRQ